MNQAGWGRPPEQPDFDPTHWWRPDNHRACKPESHLVFTGDRTSTVAGVQDPCEECIFVLDLCEKVVGVVLPCEDEGNDDGPGPETMEGLMDNLGYAASELHSKGVRQVETWGMVIEISSAPAPSRSHWFYPNGTLHDGYWTVARPQQ